ncbi:MAG: DsbA family oxidoreductase [Nitrosomonadales bacterium]
MQVEIWSDIICPWCYIGKRRFEMALTNFEHRDSVRVVWRSFELDPGAPSQIQETLVERLSRKYATTQQQASEMIARVTGVAKEVGLEYHLNDAQPGNTFDAHRLLHFAAARQLGGQATERLMQAYFCEGLAVGDHAALIRLAPQLGLGENEVEMILKNDSFADEVRADEARATELGITGVPFFVFNEKFGVSGAQPVKVFTEALQETVIV